MQAVYSWVQMLIVRLMSQVTDHFIIIIIYIRQSGWINPRLPCASTVTYANTPDTLGRDAQLLIP